MKNIAFAILGAFMIAGLASCEKEYTCVCTYPNSSVGTTETSFKTKKRDDASDKCASLNTSAQVTGGTCALK